MNIDIIYRGYMSNFLVKAKSFAFFNNKSFCNRNNVFISNNAEQIFYIKSNSINIHLDNNDAYSIDMISKYLKFVFNHNLFGIKTDNESLYRQLKLTDLNILRMWFFNEQIKKEHI